MPTSILFLAANPAQSERLALDREYRTIEESLEGSPRVAEIRLETGWAVDLARLEAKLLATRPSVIHFGGHGDREGVLLESPDEFTEGLVDAEVLAGVIGELAGDVQLVVLNACYTDAMAERLVKVVPCAVGMRSAVPDSAAAIFAAHFYRVLGHGRAVGTAYRTALYALRQMSLDDEAPRLVVAEGVDADALLPFDRPDRAAARPAALNMAPPVPASWVPRPHETRRLLDVLEPATSADGQAVCAALVGGGGHGKTSLARALAHAPEVALRFPGGVLWVSLGAEGPPIDGLAAIYAALTGERPRFASEEDARLAVRLTVGDQPFFLIVDDVWHAAQLAPFLDWGSNVTRLITTRDRRVLPPRSHEIVLGRLREDEAVALLVHSLPEPPEAHVRDALHRLASRLGGQPLALALAGPLLAANIRFGQALGDAIEELIADYAIDGPEAISSEVGRMIEASIQQLPADIQRRYRELAIFPSEAAIPLDVLAALWGLRASATWRVCLELAQRSLVEELDRTVGLRLHDVVRAHLIADLGDEARAIADRVLASWGIAAGTGPASIPTDTLVRLDDYALDHLVHFLALAGEDSRIAGLVVDVEYIALKIRRRGTAAILRDLEVAGSRLVGSTEAECLQTLARVLRKISHWSALMPDKLPGTLFNALRSLGWTEPAIAERLCWPGGELPRPRLLHPLQCVDASVQVLVCDRRGVWACAVSPGGDLLATGDRDGIVLVWDAKRGVVLERLHRHRRDVLWIAFSPEGDVLYSASRGSVAAWDLARGSERWRRETEQARIVGAALLPGGELAVCDVAGVVGFLDAVEGVVHRDLSIGRWPVDGFAVSPDGKHLVVRGVDVVVADPRTGEVLLGSNLMLGVSTVALVADRVMLIGHHDGTIRVVGPDRRERGCLVGHTGAILALCVSSDGRRLLSASADKTMRLWDLPKFQEHAVLRGHGDWVRDCAFIGDDAALSVSSDRTARIWDLRGQSEPAGERLDHGGRRVCACAINGDGRVALSGGADGRLLVWDLTSGEVTRALVGHAAPIVGVALDPDGAHAVSADADGVLCGWDNSTGAMRFRHLLDAPVVALAGFTAEGSFVVASEFFCELWAGDGYVVDGFQLDGRGSLAAISGDGRWVLSDADGALSLWEVQTRRQVRCLQDARARALCAAFSPDARRLVVGFDDGALVSWDLERGEPCLEIRGSDGPVRMCAFARNGAVVVSAGSDRLIRRSEMATGRCLSVTCGEQEFSSLAVAGSRLVAGDRTGNLWMLAE